MSLGKNINIFISSAMTELEYDREIAQRALLNMNANPVLFEVLPAMNQSAADSYLEEVRNCNIFIMLVWKSLRPAVRREYEEAVKWNKPILVFVKTLTENEKCDDELRQFLNSLATESPERCVWQTTYKYYRGVRELEDVIKESVSGEIAKFYREPIHTLSREEMYELATSIIKSTHKRLYVFQRTPSIILGARDYLAQNQTKYAYETEFIATLQEWVKNNHEVPDREFLYLFSPDATKKELEADGGKLLKHTGYIKEVKRRIGEIIDLRDKTGYRFKVGLVDVVSGPLVIGDNRFALWVLGGDDAVLISQENEKICSIVVRILRAHSQKSVTVKEILSEIGIN